MGSGGDLNDGKWLIYNINSLSFSMDETKKYKGVRLETLFCCSTKATEEGETTGVRKKGLPRSTSKTEKVLKTSLKKRTGLSQHDRSMREEHLHQ
jgi:hypothetical protein